MKKMSLGSFKQVFSFGFFLLGILLLNLGARADELYFVVSEKIFKDRVEVQSVRTESSLRLKEQNSNVKIFESDRKIPSGLILRELPAYMDGDPSLANIIYREKLVRFEDLTSTERKLFQRQKQDRSSLEAQSTEVRTLVLQGPARNRINLTILGDGYTESEKEKFFQDAEAVKEGLFSGKTFSSYLPLFNIYAVFVPSKVSGIGDGAPIETAFRLYRTPKGSKRAIMPGDEAALERALSLAPATSYPVVIANDNYYGGLGGRFAISTSSKATGLVVLRHELGHNFGEVGEEYDNGYVYSGANASSTAQVPWAHWLSGQLEVHEAKLLSGDYVWLNLKDRPYEVQFRIPQQHEQMFLELSSVGWNSSEDVDFSLNGKSMLLPGVFHEDRSFHSLGPWKVSSGENYRIRIQERVTDGNNVLGFAVAFSAPSTYDFTPDKIGAFATYDNRGRKSYRPTHKSCLMRDMEVDRFCVVDIENMWNKFFRRVRLIDEVKALKAGPYQAQQIHLSVINLPGLEVRWFILRNNTEIEIKELNNVLKWEAPPELKDKLRVRVRYQTPEVRKPAGGYLDSLDFSL